MNRKFIPLIMVVLSLLAVLPTSFMTVASGETFMIGLSLPAIEGAFFEGVQNGAQGAADALDAELVVMAADYDVEAELANVQDLIEQDVDAILLNPVDPEESLAAIEAANEAGVPVFVVGAVDIDAAELEIASLITADNAEGGALAASALCEAIEGTGTVLALVGAPAEVTDDESAMLAAIRERGEGFAAYMAESCPDATLMTFETVELDRDGVVEGVAELLRTEVVTGIFAYDAEMTLVAREAKIVARKRGIIIVGLDANQDVLDGIQSGFVRAAVTPSPFLMGQTGVETSIAFLNGDEVLERIDVALSVLDFDSVDLFAKCPPRTRCY